MTLSACGLDFGTTNSTLGLISGGTPHLVALEDGQATIPSAMFFSLEDHSTHFGRKAVFEYVDGAEGRFMRALKSVLGTSLMEETTRVGRERLHFGDIIGLFLKSLKATAETAAGAPIEKVVLGRPVHFVDDDAKADRTAEDQLAAAARAQGFSQIEFQFEPVAAALNYERDVTAEELALVVDIGGGTSDFTVIRLSPQAAKKPDRSDDILASSGVHIGGTDFDRVLSLAEVMPSLGLGSSTADGKRRMPVWYFNDLATWHRINLLYTPKIARDLFELRRESADPEKLSRFLKILEHRSGHRLAGKVEAAKIALTDAEEALISLKEPGLDLGRTITRPAFEAAVESLVAGITGSILECLSQAGIDAAAIDTVLLTGGSTQIPVVHRAATGLFPGARVVESDAFGSVGLGLAVDARRKFG
ncbi:Hsp70 family protein [Aureimonas sp. SA4125]|uniref:Hsp70 family protein n=1 Tax=Aureimonas sp. SA4125 TaxID=2826993 RepID=UPI001CC4B3CD|nr:Hsp70 family protein [Aureimonas sp. SA4125]